MINFRLEKFYNKNIPKYFYVFSGSFFPSLISFMTYNFVYKNFDQENLSNVYYLIYNSQLWGGVLATGLSTYSARLSSVNKGSFFDFKKFHLTLYFLILLLFIFLYFTITNSIVYFNQEPIEYLSYVLILAFLFSCEIYARSWFLGKSQFLYFAFTSIINSLLLSCGFIVSASGLIKSDFIIILLTVYFAQSTVTVGIHYFTKNKEQVGLVKHVLLDSSLVPLFPLILSGFILYLPHIYINSNLKLLSDAEYAKYSVSMMFLSLIVFVPNLVLKIYNPIITKNIFFDNQYVLKIYRKSFVSVLIISLIAALIMILSIEFINDYYHDLFSTDKSSLLIFIVAITLVCVQYPSANLIIAAKNFWSSLLINLTWSLSYVFFYISNGNSDYSAVASSLLYSYIVILFLNHFLAFKILKFLKY